MRNFLSAALIAVAGLATQAQAVTLTFNGSGHGGFQTVTFDQTPVTAVGTRVGAGGFSMTNTTTGENFLAYCLDITQWLQHSASYTQTSAPWSFNNIVANGGVGRVQRLFDSVYSMVDTSQESAAFQMLLWNAIYDTDLDLTTGAFRAHSSASVNAIAASFGATAGNYTGGKTYALSFFEADRHASQSLVTGSLAPVPLPAGLLLLGSALAALGLRRRRA